MEILTDLPGLEDSAQELLIDDPYRKHKARSNSDLKLLAQSPAKYVAHTRGEYSREETSAMAKGTLFHTMLLEPDEFSRKYILLPDGMETPTSSNQKMFAEKLGEGHTPKEAYDASYKSPKSQTEIDKMAKQLEPYVRFMIEARGKITVTASEHRRVQAMALAVSSHPVLEPHFAQSNALYEIPLICDSWVKGTEFLQIKGKLDVVFWFALDNEIHIEVFDVKTSGADLTFPRDTAAKFGYFNQLLMYIRLLGATIRNPELVDLNPLLDESQRSELKRLIDACRGKKVVLKAGLVFVENDANWPSCGILEPTKEDMLEANREMENRLARAAAWEQENGLGETETLLYSWDSACSTTPPWASTIDLTTANG